MNFGVTKAALSKRSSPACSPQYTMKIRAGARCKRVQGRWVLDDVSAVIGGNAHDLEHYYIWLDDIEVEPC